MGAMRMGTMGGATMMIVSSLVRQSMTRELPEKQTEGEEGCLAILQQEGWCLMREALPANHLAESLGSFRRGVEAGTSIKSAVEKGRFLAIFSWKISP